MFIITKIVLALLSVMARCTPYSGLSTFGHGKVYSIQWSEYFRSWQGVLHTEVWVLSVMARCTPYSGLSTFGHGKVYSIQWSEYFWSWQGVLHTVVGVKILKMKSVYCLIIFFRGSELVCDYQQNFNALLSLYKKPPLLRFKYLSSWKN